MLYLFTFLLAIGSAGGCVGGKVVFGKIPPTTFQFTHVVDQEGSEPGGWQVAQVAVLLGRLSNFFPRTAVCQVEVGAPIVNRSRTGRERASRR